MGVNESNDRTQYEELIEEGGDGADPARMHSHRLRRWGAASIILVAWTGGFAVWQSGGSDSQRQQQLLQGHGKRAHNEVDAPYLAFDILSAYPPLESLSLYGFDSVVEPYKNTTLAVRGGSSAVGSSYVWTIYLPDSDTFDSYIGTEVAHVFTAVSHTYTIVLTELDATGDTVATAVSTATCKYVRRDTHKLNDDDRQRTLAAMRVMFDVPGDEGRQRFGPKYISFDELLVLHLDRHNQIKCSPWHAGTNFVVAHQAMCLSVEQSLQAMDPTLSLPWMDLSFEMALGKRWRDSPMFSADWFGSFGTEENAYRVADSVFAGVKIPKDCGKPEKNAYCRLTDPYNTDDTEYLSRSDQICGLKSSGNLATCSMLLASLETETYVDFMYMVKLDIHNYLHSQFGGMWDCPFNFSQAMALAPGSAALQLFLEGPVAGVTGVMQQSLVEHELIKCPADCEGLPVDECRCYCPAVHKLIEEGRSLYDASLYIIESLEMFTSSLPAVLEEMPNAEAAEALVIWLMSFMCTPGRFSSFSSPLAAPSDPLFAFSHAFFDAMLQSVQLRNEDFENNWDNDDLCWGHSFLAHLPWHDFLDEHNAYYTNQQLQGFFNPKNPSLPYVYDSFDFASCKVTQGLRR